MKTYPKDQYFYSNGKLMITGEYLVLMGAEAFALPLNKGQDLKVVWNSGQNCLMWNTLVENMPWFEACFSLPDLVIANTNDFPIAQNVREILLAARTLNPEFLQNHGRCDITCKINFNISWGLGSSSSLISNVAKWAAVDPFALHFKISKGSGYDVAAAISDSPIIYKLEDNRPEFHKIPFNPAFKDHIFFGYLGKKRNSSEAIANFMGRESEISGAIEEITAISRKIVKAADIIEFVSLLKKHDKILASILKEKPIAKSRFRDFNGYVKSLGAWGGDFALFFSDYPREYLLPYFKKKEIKHWFAYEDIVKSEKSGQYV